MNKRSQAQDGNGVKKRATGSTTSPTNGDATGYQTAYFGTINTWNVSSVANFSNMFSQIPFTLGGISVLPLNFSGKGPGNDINNWDVSNVTNFQATFRSNQVFDGDIAGWTVSSGRVFRQMFQGATAFGTDISNWDVTGRAKPEFGGGCPDFGFMFETADAINNNSTVAKSICTKFTEKTAGCPIPFNLQNTFLADC